MVSQLWTFQPVDLDSSVLIPIRSAVQCKNERIQCCQALHCLEEIKVLQVTTYYILWCWRLNQCWSHRVCLNIYIVSLVPCLISKFSLWNDHILLYMSFVIIYFFLSHVFLDVHLQALKTNVTELSALLLRHSKVDLAKGSYH